MLLSVLTYRVLTVFERAASLFAGHISNEYFLASEDFISRHWGSSGWISYTFGLVSAWVALSLWAISVADA